MSLFEELQRAKTEEDFKDAYIKALGLKGVFKGLVDIQTPEIWFEAKESATPPLLMDYEFHVMKPSIGCHWQAELTVE